MGKTRRPISERLDSEGAAMAAAARINVGSDDTVGSSPNRRSSNGSPSAFSGSGDGKASTAGDGRSLSDRSDPDDGAGSHEDRQQPRWRRPHRSPCRLIETGSGGREHNRRRTNGKPSKPSTKHPNLHIAAADERSTEPDVSPAADAASSSSEVSTVWRRFVDAADNLPTLSSSLSSSSVPTTTPAAEAAAATTAAARMEDDPAAFAERKVEEERPEDDGLDGRLGRERMMLRQWLKVEADRGRIPGLRWIDRNEALVRIPWIHASKSSWSMDDCKLFESWAKHTGAVCCFDT